MTEIPVAAGPPCDFTPEYAAIMSVMNLADYSQVKVCAQCAPEYLTAIIAALTGGMPEGGDASGVMPAGDDGQVAADAEPGACPMCGQVVLTADVAAHVDAHMSGRIDADGNPVTDTPAKPDPLTANVRKSTHGHRTPKGAASTAAPAGDDPE